MRVIKIDRRKVSKKILAQVAAALQAGAVVVYPTETAYGLAADPANDRAVRKIFAIKGRRADKQLPFIAGSLLDAAETVKLTGLSLKLAKKYWPGPLTIVAPLRSAWRIYGLSGRGPATAAVRVPASIWARAIARSFGGPITSTSANISGRPAAYDPAVIRRDYSRRRTRPDILLDAGRLPPRRPSTIVKVERGKMIVLRPGPIIPKIR